ncbi:MAG: tetratricopeptide repeat protein [Geminicoccaceae bacterium]|nr:tetratricopeptide repeat protein [Geminicoccaceae bacterium]MCB9943610.1 tetratricopeptide repeat protein [Geminicoccaceae bacterium]
MFSSKLQLCRTGLVATALVLTLAGCQMGPGDAPRTPGARAELGELGPAAQAERLLRMARDAQGSGDLATAAALYDHVLAREPKNLDALRSLGGVLDKLGRPQEASEAYSAALAVSTDDIESTLGYARSMIALGRPEAAAAHVDPVLEKHPDDLHIINMAAVIYDMQAEHARAAELYRRGLYYDPSSISLQNNLGLSLALSGDTEGAIGVLKPLAESGDSTPRIRQNLALAYGLNGDILAARRIASLDLDAAAVDNNLAYYSGLQAMQPSQTRAAVLRPDITALPLGQSRELGTNVVVGIGLGGEDLSVGGGPVESWFLDLGEYGTAEAAIARWSVLQTRFADLTRGLQPLAQDGTGNEPLLVGPVATAAEATRLCRVLSAQSASCTPVQL